MADEINIVVTATDNFSAVLGNFGNIMTGIKSTIDMVAGAFNSVVDFGSQFVDAAAESQVRVTALNQVLQSTGDTAGFTLKQLQDMATSMMDLSGNSDEAEMSAEAMLLRFENINKDIFPETLQLTNDLARSIGMDLTSAAQTMGKALDDPASGIGRLNMQFKLFDATEMDNIKTMAEHGQLAEAQAIIMDRLREKVGGAAEAYGTTFAGKLDIAKEKLDNIKELIGGPIINVLGSMIDKITEFANTNPVFQTIIGFLTQWNDLLNNGAPMLTALGVSLINLEQFSPVFHDIGVAMLQFQEALDQGKDPLTSFQLIMDRLASSDSPLAKVAQFLLDIANQFAPGGGGFTGALQIVGQYINDWIVSLNLGDKLQSALDGLADAVNRWSASGGGDRLSAMLGNIIGGAVKFALDGLDKTIGQVDFAPIVTALLSGFGKALWSMMQGFGDTFWSTFATTVFKDTSVDNFWASTRIGGERLLNALFPVTTIPDVIAKAKEIIQAIDEGLQQGIRSIGLGGLLDFWKTILDDVKRLFGIASPSTVFYNIGRDIVQGLINGILGAIAPLTTAVESIVSVIAKPLSGVLDFLGIGSSAITGTTGGRDMTGLSPDTRSGYSLGGGLATSGSSTVNYNFYGPVYMSGVPAAGSYDCAPNPVIQSGSNQLVINGFR